MISLATSKLAPSDAIQKLIIESAQAERYEREEHLLEAEARKRGDKKLAEHLRGALAPGDKNYNPHHHVDDFAGDDGEGGGAAAGDGAAYAGGGDGNGGGEHREEHNMHNHFMEALKQDVHHLKQGKDKVVESIKESIKQKVRHAQEMVHPPPPDGGPEDPATHGDDEVIHGDVHGDPFPHMARPVDPDHDFSRWEPPGGSRFAEYKGGDAPYRITRKTLQQSDEVARSRRVHVLGAMKHIWKNYKEYAFGRDELHSLSKKATSNWGGMGTTLVDSLDTLWLMGLKEEFYEGRDWVRDHLEHGHVGRVSGFETTIRSLGGLLAAHDCSKDPVFLQKADDLGSRLVKAYNTPSGLPHGNIDLGSGSSSNFGWNSSTWHALLGRPIMLRNPSMCSTFCTRCSQPTGCCFRISGTEGENPFFLVPRCPSEPWAIRRTNTCLRFGSKAAKRNPCTVKCGIRP